MSAHTNPIYDQTVAAQGWDPIREKYLVVTDEIRGDTLTATLSPWQAREIKKGNISGYSIRKGGKRR